jgi:translin
MAEEVLELRGLQNVDLEDLRERARSVIASIDAVLSKREELRDSLIKNGRDIIRLSGWAINALHRGRLEDSRKYITDMREKTRNFIELARKDPMLWYSGFVNNVLSEYAEAVILYSLVVEGNLPNYQDLGIGEIPYLQGFGDVLGELRRLALDLIRRERLDLAEKTIDIMETLYYEMRALEYPDALMPGVRHKVDVARRLIDDTKALLLTVKARLGR